LKILTPICSGISFTIPQNLWLSKALQNNGRPIQNRTGDYFKELVGDKRVGLYNNTKSDTWYEKKKIFENTGEELLQWLLQ
jgi:hypothetical protein